MVKASTRVRRIIAGMTSALAVTAMALAGAAPASSAVPSAKAPYPAGESYRVSQGPGGGWSHNNAYNRYAYDFAMPANYEVSAVQAGTIIASGWSAYWQNGIEVIIRHSNGQCTHYAHLNRALYRTGTYVPQGRVVGWTGATGAASGPHLHFQAINCYTRVGISQPVEGWYPRAGSWVRSSNHRR